MDTINAGFEMGGVFAMLPSIFAILRDRKVAGVSLFTPLFFVTWGLWNIPFYYTLEQSWSAMAAVLLTLTNGLYLALLYKYREVSTMNIKAGDCVDCGRYWTVSAGGLSEDRQCKDCAEKYPLRDADDDSRKGEEWLGI